MALDPSIILGVKPVDQPADPYRQYQVAAQLKDAAQQRQVRDLEIQGIQKQQETASAVNDAMTTGLTIDKDTGLPTLNRALVLQKLQESKQGNAAFGLQQEWQKQDLTKQKDMLDQQKTALENLGKHVDLMSGFATRVLSAPKELQPQVYQQLRQYAIQSKLSDPTELPEQFDPQALVGVQSQALKAKEVMDLQAKQIDQNQKSVDLAQQASRNAADAMYKQGELSARAQSDATTRRGQNLTDARDRQKIAIENGRLQFQKNQAGLGDDGQPLPVVDAIGSGRINAGNLSRILTKNPGLISAVAQKYPDFDTSKIDAYTALVKTIEGGGKEGQQLNSGATVAKHLQELAALNTVASRIPGSAAHQAYQNKVDTLAPELAGFYGHTTDTSIKDLKATLNATFNRDIAIKTQAGSMLDKLDTFEQQWKDAAPSKVYESQLPNTVKNAQESLRSFVGGRSGEASGGKISVAAPDGSVHPFDSQAQADHFKKLAGIK
jgi:hypothetical protein